MESEIITQFQQGNLREFGRLYDEYVKKVYAFIYFKTHHRETAEDLTSIVFMKAMENIRSFDAKKAPFKAWLFQIARNTVIDHYRTFREPVDIEDAWDLKSGQDVERDVEMELKVQAVQKYMEKLKPEQREIVLLRVWGDHSFKEIAEITGKSEAAAKMMFKRVIDTLRGDFALLAIALFLIR
jgi:RNA polymerase sigma-70 factor, ECF subfamily